MGATSASIPPGTQPRDTPSATHDERHVGRRVGGERGRPVGVDHRLGVAVVGRDERHAARRSDRRDDRADAGIDGLDGRDRRLEDAGVAHHVAVRVVDDVDVGASSSIASTSRSVTSGSLISGLRS